MRRSTAVRLVIIGATGLGVTAIGLSHGLRNPAPQPVQCNDGQDDSPCNRSSNRSYGGGGGEFVGSARQAEDESGASKGGGETADAAALHGVSRGGFGEAGAAHGGSGGE